MAVSGRCTCIEKAQETYSSNRTTESIPEGLQICKHFLLLLLLFFGIVLSLLPIGECFPCESSHLLIACTEQTNMIKHLREKTCDVSSTTEPEDKDIIVVIPLHEESIGSLKY